MTIIVRGHQTQNDNSVWNKNETTHPFVSDYEMDSESIDCIQ